MIFLIHGIFAPVKVRQERKEQRLKPVSLNREHKTAANRCSDAIPCFFGSRLPTKGNCTHEFPSWAVLGEQSTFMSRRTVTKPGGFIGVSRPLLSVVVVDSFSSSLFSSASSEYARRSLLVAGDDHHHHHHCSCLVHVHVKHGTSGSTRHWCHGRDWSHHSEKPCRQWHRRDRSRP